MKLLGKHKTKMGVDLVAFSHIIEREIPTEFRAKKYVTAMGTDFWRCTKKSNEWADSLDYDKVIKIDWTTHVYYEMSAETNTKSFGWSYSRFYDINELVKSHTATKRLRFRIPDTDALLYGVIRGSDLSDAHADFTEALPSIDDAVDAESIRKIIELLDLAMTDGVLLIT